MSNQLVWKGVYRDGSINAKVYSKKGLAKNAIPKTLQSVDGVVVIEYELVPTGRKFNKEGNLIE